MPETRTLQRDVVTARLDYLFHVSETRGHARPEEIQEMDMLLRSLEGDRENRNNRQPGRQDVRHDPREAEDGVSTLDLAIAGWTRSQAGVPIGDDLYEACRSLGVSPNSGAVEIPFERSSPRIGRELFGRHERRALGTQVLGSGGAIVPQGFIPRFEQAMLDASGMLQAAEVMRTPDGRELPWPTTDDTSNEGELIGENVAVGEQDVTFGQHVFRAYKLSSKLVRVSAELLEDSAINLAGELGGMLGTRIGRTTNRLLTVGTGAGQPHGIVPDSTVGVTAASASAIAADELISLVHSVDVAYRSGASFMMHDATLATLRKLKDGDGQYMFQQSLQLGQPDRLLGYPIVINSHVPVIAASTKVVLFGQLSKYKARFAGALRVRRLTERYAENDQEGFIAFQRIDGKLLDAGTNPVKALEMHA